MMDWLRTLFAGPGHDEAQKELEKSKTSLAEARGAKVLSTVIATRHENARRRNHIRQAMEAELRFSK